MIEPTFGLIEEFMNGDFSIAITNQESIPIKWNSAWTKNARLYPRKLTNISLTGLKHWIFTKQILLFTKLLKSFTGWIFQEEKQVDSG